MIRRVSTLLQRAARFTLPEAGAPTGRFGCRSWLQGCGSRAGDRRGSDEYFESTLQPGFVQIVTGGVMTWMQVSWADVRHSLLLFGEHGWSHVPFPITLHFGAARPLPGTGQSESRVQGIVQAPNAWTFGLEHPCD